MGLFCIVLKNHWEFHKMANNSLKCLKHKLSLVVKVLLQWAFHLIHWGDGSKSHVTSSKGKKDKHQCLVWKNCPNNFGKPLWPGSSDLCPWLFYHQPQQLYKSPSPRCGSNYNTTYKAVMAQGSKAQTNDVTTPALPWWIPSRRLSVLHVQLQVSTSKRKRYWLLRGSL